MAWWGFWLLNVLPPALKQFRWQYVGQTPHHPEDTEALNEKKQYDIFISCIY